MITARTAMESRVENLEGRLRELRKEYLSWLDEIKQLWKRRKGDYSRRRSRRDHATSRRRTPTMYAKKEKDAEDEDNGRRSDGSDNSVFYTVTQPGTHKEGELKANREFTEEGKFQVARKVETEVEGDGGDVSDLSKMKMAKEEDRHLEGGRRRSDDGCCSRGSNVSVGNDGRCVGGGRGSWVETRVNGERAPPPEPPDRSVLVKKGWTSPTFSLPSPKPPDRDVAVKMETSSTFQLPPPELSKSPEPKAALELVRTSHGLDKLLLLLVAAMIPNTGERKNGVRAAQQAGQGVELMGQAQHDERKTRILEFVSHLRIRECDSENAWMEFGPNITGTWPIKFGFTAEAIDKHKALGGTQIEVPSVQGPVYIFSANINVGTFTNSMMHGDLCNITTHPSSCTPCDIHYAWEDIINKPMLESVESGKSNFEMFGVDEDITRGTAGGNTHIRLSSYRSDKINVGLGGLLSLDSLNYVYASKPRRSGPFMFFMQYDSSDAKFISILCMLVEGTWSSGLKHFNTSNDSSKAPTIMSLSLERCPKRCPSHGDCNLSFDTSGLTSYSFCFCDQHHGDSDCRIEIATCQGKVWQAIFLIVWNAGAILVAYWSLKQKALAEWVKLTFSGTLSYIINNSQGGRVFNEVVAEAKEAGYTEPDTRNDLSGTNVAVESADIVLVQSSLEEVLKWWQNWVPQIELTSQLGSLTSDGRDIPVAGKKHWDPGGPRHTTTVAPQSGFKQWDPGKV